MAQKQEFTLEDVQLAESLHIKTQNLSKSQLIRYILGQRPSVTPEQQLVQESDTVVQSQVLSDSQSTPEAHMKYQLELKRLEFEERRIQAEMEDRKAKLEMERAQMAFQKRKWRQTNVKLKWRLVSELYE